MGQVGIQYKLSQMGHAKSIQGELFLALHCINNYATSDSLSALEVCYENALYKFTFDIDIWHW